MRRLIRLNGIILLISQRRPLLFFGLPAVVLLAVALALGLEVAQVFSNVRILLVGQLIVAVALGIIGTLSLFTAIMLNALQGIRSELRSRR